MANVIVNRDMSNTLTGGATSRQIIDMSDVIDILNPSATPFLVISNKGLGKRNAHNLKYEWFTDTPLGYVDTLNGSIVAGDTTITVTDGTLWKVWDTGVELANYDVFRVTSVSTNDLVVAWITTPTLGVANATKLVNLTSAYESGADYKAPTTTKETADYNYIQIARETVGMDEVLQATVMYGGPDWPYQVRKKGVEHAKGLERALLFGERSYVTSGTHPYGTTRGIKKFLSTNVTTSFGAMSLTTLNTQIRAATDNDHEKTSKPYIFTSSLVADYISRLTHTLIRVEPGPEQVFGISVNRIVCPAVGPPVTIVTHPLFTDISSLQDCALFLSLNPERIKRVSMNNNGINLNTHVRANIQDPGETIRVDEWYTAFGLELHWEKVNAWWEGITAPA